jgi:hypothetical protein
MTGDALEVSQPTSTCVEVLMNDVKATDKCMLE